MKKIEIKELKEIQVKILDVFVKFCEDNNLKYFLTYGTLLGAIRHKGYIPWDDDIDVSMPRPDYERFIETFNNQESDYKVIHHTINEKYPIPIAKVYDSRTTLIEQFSDKFNVGINIDIFPIDGLPDDKNKAVKHLKKVIFWRNVQNTKNRSIAYKSIWYKNLLVLLLKLPTAFISDIKINKIISKLATTYDYKTSNFVANCTAPDGVHEILEKSKTYSDQTEVPFEGKTYKAPNGYDNYLKTIYGDYMKFPPLEQQVSEHFSKAYWK